MSIFYSHIFGYLHAPLVESIEMNPDNYRYKLAEDDMLIPTITTKVVIQDDILVLRKFFKMC